VAVGEGVRGGKVIKRRRRKENASTGVAIQGSSTESTATEPGRSIATELLIESTTPTSAISRDVRQTLHQGLFSVPAESALFDGQATPKSTRSAETSCPAMLFTLCTCNGRRLCKETAQVSKRCRRLAWVLYVTQGCDAYTAPAIDGRLPPILRMPNDRPSGPHRDTRDGPTCVPTHTCSTPTLNATGNTWNAWVSLTSGCGHANAISDVAELDCRRVDWRSWSNPPARIVTPIAMMTPLFLIQQGHCIFFNDMWNPRYTAPRCRPYAGLWCGRICGRLVK
jgi:hypothetical protein